MVSISVEFKAKEITVSSFHPGWVRTDMGGPNATLSTKESAESLIKSFENLTFENTGKFFNYDGSLISFWFVKHNIQDFWEALPIIDISF